MGCLDCVCVVASRGVCGFRGDWAVLCALCLLIAVIISCYESLLCLYAVGIWLVYGVAFRRFW